MLSYHIAAPLAFAIYALLLTQQGVASTEISKGSDSNNKDAKLVRGLLRQRAQRVKPTVTLSSSTTSFGKDDPVIINFSIRNDGAKPAQILKWFLPEADNETFLEEDIFSVTYTKNSGQSMVAGQSTALGEVHTVRYVGANYKRMAPMADDYQVLKAGAGLTLSFDLAQYYDFSETGIYEITYHASNPNLFSTTDNSANGEMVSLTSNQLRLNIAGRSKPIASVSLSFGTAAAITGSATNRFISCTVAQQSLIIQARSDALSCSTYLSDTYMPKFYSSSTHNRYTTWFGRDTTANVGTITSHFDNIKAAFQTADMTFDCSCQSSGVYAYVYPSQPYKIYLCPVFWNAPSLGTDSKQGTLVHEMSHFTVVAATNDVKYGQSNCLSLAKKSPSKAITNADSHEYFCESNDTS